MSPVSDLAQQLLQCLEDAYVPEVPEEDRPGLFCLRVGQVAYSIGLIEDLCCTGFAWVRVIRVFPVGEDLAERTVAANCAPSLWGVELEMGVVRCLPDHGAHSGATCDEWTAVFLQVDEDAAAMRRALCCMKDTSLQTPPASDLFLPGEWEPIDPEGMCVGGTMRVTFAYDCAEC